MLDKESRIGPEEGVSGEASIAILVTDSDLCA